MNANSIHCARQVNHFVFITLIFFSAPNSGYSIPSVGGVGGEIKYPNNGPVEFRLEVRDNTTQLLITSIVGNGLYFTMLGYGTYTFVVYEVNGDRVITRTDIEVIETELQEDFIFDYTVIP